MLMQARGSKADAAKMAQLEESLSQKASELATLNNKYTRLERQNRDIEGEKKEALLFQTAPLVDSALSLSRATSEQAPGIRARRSPAVYQHAR